MYIIFIMLRFIILSSIENSRYTKIGYFVILPDWDLKS